MARKTHTLGRRAFTATRSFLRFWQKDAVAPGERVGRVRPGGIKVAFIYGEKRSATGADHINKLMARALAAQGARIRAFYPRIELRGAPQHLRGLKNILFFHSLLEHKTEILKNDIIQGTTYTPLPFLTFDTPVVSHFGSTTRGFLESTPATAKLPARERAWYRDMYEVGIIPEFDFKTFRPLEDTADIEELVALHADACVATSQNVKNELMRAGVPEERIRVIHNAIEDYWFDGEEPHEPAPPHLVFLGRLGGDVFTLKLKGLSRLLNLYKAFPQIPKTTVCMTTNKPLKEWMRVAFDNHHLFVNLRKDLIPGVLRPRFGSILLLTSRYEGFSLSLIEGMSQGLVPVAFPVGVVPELIKDGVNGYIVHTAKEAEARTRELLENSDARLAMARAAKEAARAFRGERTATELLALYRELKAAHKEWNVARQA